MESGPVFAAAVPGRTGSAYPAPFKHIVDGRTKHALGDAFGLEHFGVNLTELAPGAADALQHAHSVQDELFYILKGAPTLIVDGEETPLAPGMCVGFRGGTGIGHQIRNDTHEVVHVLEVGDRMPGDTGTYPEDDLVAIQGDAGWAFQHKDGTPYDSP